MTIRFGDYVREMTLQATEISYSHLMPRIETDENGQVIPLQPGKLQLRPLDIYRLLKPYISTRLFEQIRAVVPLAFYLGLFQIIVLRQKINDASVISMGLLAVMTGLTFFMEGLKLGLMPFGEIIGNTLPQRVRLPIVLIVTFILGVGVTFAEPALGALQVAGSIVDPQKAPYLHTLLTDRSWATLLIVGAGVGIAAVLGTLRFVYGWSLKPLVYFSLIPTLLLSSWMHFSPELSTIIGMSWDCGAVTTGPVTVPLVIALGIGVSAAVGKSNSPLSGFGIVTLASIFPILGVLLYGIITSIMVSPEFASNAAANIASASTAWYNRSPGVEVITGIRAIIPLVVFLIFILTIILRERLNNAGTIRYGITLSVIGMILFNLGLTYGLSKLGSQSGNLVPGTFTHVEYFVSSPLFSKIIGVIISAVFAWVLGFCSTLAEPALNAFGITVENLTCGTLKKNALMFTVSVGVAMGIMLGIIKIIYTIPVAYILIPGYFLALILTHFSSEEFVNIGWDSAGVTTGPVTVPLVLTMGLGFGKATGALEGFGILAAASVCPIISVLVLGIIIRIRADKINKQHVQQADVVNEVFV